MLPDSAHIQEEDARQANRHRYSKHVPALPLYTEIDAGSRARSTAAGRLRPTHAGAFRASEVEFINAGHLLGSAYARMTHRRQDAFCSAAISGRYGRPVLPDPTPVSEADILLLESTYGDRLHEPDDDGERLARDRRTTSPPAAAG